MRSGWLPWRNAKTNNGGNKLEKRKIDAGLTQRRLGVVRRYFQTHSFSTQNLTFSCLLAPRSV